MNTYTPPRTFGDLLVRDRFSEYGRGTCRFCGSYNTPTTYYATRHVVCRDCCAKRQDEVLPAILRSEAKARRMVKAHASAGARFISVLSGASQAYVESLLRNQINEKLLDECCGPRKQS